MMNPFKQLGDLNQMRQQASQIQRELQAEKVEVEKNGVEIIISGDQKVQSIKVHGEEDNNLKDAINEAIKKSQEVAAKKMQGMMGGLGGLLK